MENEIGYWSAGVLYDVGGIEWLRAGKTYKASNQSWLKRSTASSKAKEMFEKRTDRYNSWRPGHRDNTKPRKPVAAVVGSPIGFIELVDGREPDAKSYGCDLWWAVLKKSAFGMYVKSLHSQRIEAESLAEQPGCCLGLASTSGMIGYVASRITSDSLSLREEVGIED